MQPQIPTKERDRDALVLALKRAIIEVGFNESAWKELSYLTDAREWITSHPRLLRSLKWNDDDYESHVFAAIEYILEQDPANMQILLTFRGLGEWIRLHHPAIYDAIFTGTTVAPGHTESQEQSTGQTSTTIGEPDRLYDVAISFAGEDRSYAEALAEELRRRGIKVFYDAYEKALLWGKDLYVHLSDVYQHRARYCVMFLSEHYAQKTWTNHERAAAQARAFQEHREYILPVRLDATTIPGVLPTIGYLAWPPETAKTIADAIMIKLSEDPPLQGRQPPPLASTSPSDPARDESGARSATPQSAGEHTAHQAWSPNISIRSMKRREHGVGTESSAPTHAAAIIDLMLARFFLLFAKHNVPVASIPLLLQDFGITLSTLKDEDRLADLLSEQLIAYLSNLFQVEPMWLRGGSLYATRHRPTWYKQPDALCAHIAEQRKTSLWVHVHFIKNSKRPGRLETL